MFTIGKDRVALVTDTSCDLSDEQLRRYDIRTISLRVNTSHGEYRDRQEIDAERVYELLKTELPKTSLPLPEDVSECYRHLRDEGCTRILHLSMSSALSGTYNMVRILAEDFEGLTIDVVDSLTLSCGLGLLVLTAGDLLEKGCAVEDVIASIERLRKTQLGAYVIRTLEYLRKGGRIGRVEGVVGTLLQIKPVICVSAQGVYETMAKARGFSNAVNAMCDEFFKRYAGKRVNVAIVHGNAMEEAIKLKARFQEKLNVATSFISPISPALAIHTGPGLVGAIVQDAE